MAPCLLFPSAMSC